MPTVARQLAHYTTGLSYDQLPAPSVHAAKRALLDAVGCALGGYGCAASRILEETIQDTDGRHEATIIGSGRRTTCLNALMVNSAMIRYLDFNDAYMVVTPHGITGAHPSDAIGTILAVAERERRSGKDVITATALAYQLYGRMAESERIPLANKGWTIEAKAPLFMPLVAGKLLGLSEEQLEQAVGISGSHGFVLGILDTDGEEYSMTKNIRLARTGYNGVLAAYMARRGFTGPRRVIEGHMGFNEVVMGGDLDFESLRMDGEGYCVDSTYFKLFSADGTQLGHLSATYDLVSRHNLKPEDIASVRLQATNRCVKHCAGPEKLDPTTKEIADHSAYYTTAALICDRALGPAQYTPERLRDPQVRALMQKVSVTPNSELDKFGAAGISEITTVTGEVYQARVDYPRGHPKNRMPDDELNAKFASMATPVVGKARAQRLQRMIWRFEELDSVAPFMRALTFKTKG
ncbi:MAG: MmgE/PrpD family protein [Deltaproteobacteria bacterium]|nr:MmgE/PrpD family protein [Deltaproteobacteria bacterium]